jgi:hypothetical protein
LYSGARPLVKFALVIVYASVQPGGAASAMRKHAAQRRKATAHRGEDAACNGHRAACNKASGMHRLQSTRACMRARVARLLRLLPMCAPVGARAGEHASGVCVCVRACVRA